MRFVIIEQRQDNALYPQDDGVASKSTQEAKYPTLKVKQVS